MQETHRGPHKIRWGRAWGGGENVGPIVRGRELGSSKNGINELEGSKKWPNSWSVLLFVEPDGVCTCHPVWDSLEILHNIVGPLSSLHFGLKQCTPPLLCSMGENCL